MANGDPDPPIEVDTERLLERALNGAFTARPVSTRTAQRQPARSFRTGEESFNEQNTGGLREEDKDRPFTPSEDEKSLLDNVNAKSGLKPTIFVRSGGSVSNAGGRAEGEEATFSDPNLTPEPSDSTQIILSEDRFSTAGSQGVTDSSNTQPLRHELVHAAHNKLGTERVNSIIDSLVQEGVANQDQAEEIRDETDVDLEGDYENQPHERLAYRLQERFDEAFGDAPTQDTLETRLLRSMMERASGNSNTESREEVIQDFFLTPNENQ